MTTARARRTSSLGALLAAGGAVATARATSLLLAAVQIPLVARLLPADEFSIVPASVQLAGLVGLLVADPAVLAFQRRPGAADDRRHYRWAVRWTILGLTLGAVALVVAGAASGLLELAVGVAGWTLGVTVNRLSAVAWLMWGREWRYTAALLASTATRTAVLLGTLVAGWSAPLAVASAGAASAVVAIVAAPRRRPADDAEPSASAGGDDVTPDVHRPTLRLGAGLAVGQLGIQVQSVAPLLVATALLGTAATGALGAATQVAAVVAACLNLGTTLAYPRLRRTWDSGGAGAVLTVARLLVGGCFAVGAWAVVTLCLGDLALLRRALPSGLVDGRLVVAVTVGVCLSSIGLVSSWLHQFRLHTALIARRSLFTAGVAVGLVAVGTLVGGVTGATAGAVVGLSVYATSMIVGSGLLGPGSLASVVGLTATGLGVIVAGDESWTLVATGAAVLALAGTARLVLQVRRLVSRDGVPLLGGTT